MAPECVRNQKVGLEADIWSLGCILYQLISGLLPFRGGSDYLIFRRSTEARYNDHLSCIPDEAFELIKSCLRLSPSDRPTIEKLLSHPYLNVVEPPVLDGWQLQLRIFLDDVIKRANVFEFDGQQNFEAHFGHHIRGELLSKWPSA